MLIRTVPGGLLLLAALLQVSCVASARAPSCTFEGAKHFPAVTGQDDLCGLFMDNLANELEKSGKSEGSNLHSIAINAHKRGTISAVMVVEGADGLQTLPEISFDVLDRPLAVRDLEELAQVAAGQLALRS